MKTLSSVQALKVDDQSKVNQALRDTLMDLHVSHFHL
jgi:hypothetical protein